MNYYLSAKVTLLFTKFLVRMFLYPIRTSLLRNGILKEYHIPLLRLGLYNAPNNINKQIKRTWHNQYTFHHRNDIVSSVMRKLAYYRTYDGQYYKRTQQQIGNIMTSKSSCYMSNDADGKDNGCSGTANNNLKPTCDRPKEKRVPVCSAAPDNGSPCAVTDVSGPCQNELQLSMTTATDQLKAQITTEPVARTKHHGATKQGMKREQPSVKSCCHQPLSRSLRPGSSSILCQADATNACRVPTRAADRLRYPAIPKHLLKRKPRCFQECGLERRRQSNCDRMFKNESKKMEERPPNPMKVPKSKCVEIRRCKQMDCAILHMFPSPPRSEKDIPPAVLPYPKDLCGKPDPDTVQDEEQTQLGIDERNIGATCSNGSEVTCNLRRPALSENATMKNKCDIVAMKTKPTPPYCTYSDDECFQCISDADLAHPAYPDPICPPIKQSTIKPQKVKNRNVLDDVPCAKRCLKCEERLELDTYCDPCYKTKEVHTYSDTAYYDLHNYMAARRRMPTGPNHHHRRSKPWKDDGSTQC